MEKSTVPVRTAEHIRNILVTNKVSETASFEVVCNPEFLAEGTAINDLLQPSRILIGNFESKSGRRAGNIIADIYQNWVPKENILLTNVWSAELGKLASNAFLAQRVSSSKLLFQAMKVGTNIYQSIRYQQYANK